LKGRRREQVNSTTVAVRGLGLPGGRFEILSSLERHGTSESASDEARMARQLLSRLDRDLEPLRRVQTFEGWSRIVAHLGSQLGFRPQARLQVRGEKNGEDPTIARLEATFEQRDRNDWEVFDRVLFDAVRTEKMLGTATQSMGLEEFVRRLDDLLATQSVARRGPEAGRVRVLDAAQVRNLDIPYLILANLTESSFPRARGDDCLYGESERRQLNEQGLSLGHHSSQGQDEMLLFYGIVTRARRRLVLSYPSVNAKGQPGTRRDTRVGGTRKLNHGDRTMLLQPLTKFIQRHSSFCEQVETTWRKLERQPDQHALGTPRELFENLRLRPREVGKSINRQQGELGEWAKISRRQFLPRTPETPFGIVQPMLKQRLLVTMIDGAQLTITRLQAAGGACGEKCLRPSFAPFQLGDQRTDQVQKPGGLGNGRKVRQGFRRGEIVDNASQQSPFADF